MQMQAVQSFAQGQAAAGEQIVEGRPTAITKILVRLSRMLRMVAEERGRRRAIQELRRLDNHLLADIGIRRGEIERAVRNGRGGL